MIDAVGRTDQPSSRGPFISWRPAALIALCLTAAIGPTQAQPTPGGDGNTTASTADSRVQLKPVIKTPPKVVSLKPVVKGQAPEPTPTPEPSPTAKPTPAAKPESPGTESAAPGPTPKPRATAKARPELTEEKRAEIAALLAGPDDAPTRARLREFVIEHRDSPMAAPALFKIAEISGKLNQPAEARRAYEGVLKFKQADQELLARAQAELAALTSATAGAAAPATAPPAPAQAAFDPAPLANKALEFTLDGKYAEAQGAWQELDATLANPPGSIDGALAQAMQSKLLLGRALVAELNRDDAEARRLLIRLLELHPQAPEAAMAQARLDDIGRALIEAPIEVAPTPATEPQPAAEPALQPAEATAAPDAEPEADPAIETPNDAAPASEASPATPEAEQTTEPTTPAGAGTSADETPTPVE